MMFTGTLTVLKRELAGYFLTPLAYVFLIIFLFLTGIFTFYPGSFLEQGQADLKVFFGFHPWLYLFLIPALSMRLWSEEYRTGAIELLLTLPISLAGTVVGKFLAAWMFTGLALLLTTPLWITVNWLGEPDNGIILAGYIGSFLMAGAYLAIGSCLSAATRNQVIAFIVTVAVCFLFVASGMTLVLDAFSAWAPDEVVTTVASFSFLGHFDAITAGVVDLRDLVFFLSLIGVWLVATMIVIRQKVGG